MNEFLKRRIEQGKVILMLGAGCSHTSRNRNGEKLPMANGLAKKLATESGLNYKEEPLSTIFGVAKNRLGDTGIEKILDELYNHTTPSEEYLNIAKYSFPRIYTLNIDDALERALSANSKQNIRTIGRKERVTEIDQFCNNLDVIKLNGDIKKPSDGFVFSKKDYATESSNPPLWYEEAANDFHNYTFLFIGTKLDEPLLNLQIERFKEASGLISGLSYLIVPEVTEIEEEDLKNSKIEVIKGYTKDFSEWLKKEFPNGLSPKEILYKKRPELNLENVENKSKYIEIFSSVIPVARANLSIAYPQKNKSGIREFYRGSKPDWRDIIDAVPAELEKTKEITTNISKLNGGEVCAILGNAGCGKSTSIMQMALKIADSTSHPVYYIESIDNEISELIFEIEKANNGRYYIFIDRLADVAFDLANSIKSNKAMNGVFIGAENKGIWSSRVAEHIEEFCKIKEDITLIGDNDAEEILKKIKMYGNWTRLSKMSKSDRVKEILKKSKKQLLIGLIETTTGTGYTEIIKSDFNRLPSKSHEHLLTLVGLATAQRTKASEATITRALKYLGCNESIPTLLKDMDGIINYKNGSMTARHFVYIEKLFTEIINKDDLLRSFYGYIDSFSAYESPIGKNKNISKSELSVYRYLVNAKTLARYFPSREDEILGMYKHFEKKMENEGLFLLQYGLALRKHGDQQSALEKIEIANIAFPDSPQIEHALALQKIIMAIRSDSETQALSLFEDSKEILKRLDKSEVNVFDAYPIVTLSEGHVKICEKFQGRDKARFIAKKYYEEMEKRKNISHKEHILSTIEKLKYFSLSGSWKNPLDLEAIQ